MLQKARQPKHGGHKTILERWQKDDEYRTSLLEIGWTEEQIIQDDELALEDHRFSATRDEGDRNENIWVLTLNKEGAQSKTRNEKTAWWTCERDFLRKDCTPSILHNGYDNEEDNNSKDSKNTNYRVDQTGWEIIPTEPQGNLARQTPSSSSTNLKYQDTWTTRSISSRQDAWLKLEGSGLHIFVSQNKCHPRVMSLSLPHLTLTTSTSSRSPTSPIFPTITPTPTRPSVHDDCSPCDDPRQSGGSTQIPSLTGYEPEVIEIKPEDLEPRWIEFDTNLRTDPYQATA